VAVGGDDGLTNGLPVSPPPPVASYPEPDSGHLGERDDPRDGQPPEASADGDEAQQGEHEYHLGPGDRFYVYRPPWRRPRVILLVVLGVVLFFIPLSYDGLWWLTLAVSVAVIGVLAVLASPAHRPQAAIVALVVALLAFVGLEAYNDVAFGTLSLRGPPPLIFACGAEYTQSSPSPVTVGRAIALHRVGITPSGLALLGNARCGGPASVWAFVSVGPGRVLPYLADHYTGPSVPYGR
jgi:hypothetical protein